MQIKDKVSGFLNGIGFEVSLLSSAKLKDFHDWFNTTFIRNSKYILERFERIGGEADGGYWFPKVDLPIAYLISPGVGASIAFDIEMAQRGTTCLLFDKSLEESNLKFPNELNSHLRFIKRDVGLVNDNETVTLSDILANELEPGLATALQMDIEGAEYLTLASLSHEEMLRFDVLIIEFHSVTSLFFNSFLGWQFRQVVAKLMVSHELIYSQANIRGGYTSRGRFKVPHAIETTWIRKGLAC